MDCIQLYNIETGTLIKLNPKNLGLTVNDGYVQQYFLSKPQFAIIYFLCISRPHIVEYNDFKRALEDIGLTYPGNKKFIHEVSVLKKILVSYGVKALIVKVRGHGYTISNKWVPPEQHTESFRKERFARFIKLVGVTFSNILR